MECIDFFHNLYLLHSFPICLHVRHPGKLKQKINVAHPPCRRIDDSTQSTQIKFVTLFPGEDGKHGSKFEAWLSASICRRALLVMADWCNSSDSTSVAAAIRSIISETAKKTLNLENKKVN
jgi:hypothetical protein